MSTSETLHFVITGEFLTRQARDYWTEDEHEKAIKLLETAFPTMPESMRMDVITGKKKILGENDKCYVEPDKATEHRGIKLLSYADAMAQAKNKFKEEKAEHKVTLEIANGDFVTMASPWGLLHVPRSLTRTRPSKSGPRPYCIVEWDEFEIRFPQLVEKAIEGTADKKQLDEDRRAIDKEIRNQKKMIDRFRQRNGFDGGSLLDAVPIELRAAAAAVLAPPLKEVPKPDNGMRSRNGWLSPDGKFYPCGFMGHVRLAAALSDGGEPQLEKAWVKIQDSHDPNAVIERIKRPGSDFVHIPDRGVTQAQLNAMQRWCEKHGRELPPHLVTR